MEGFTVLPELMKSLFKKLIFENKQLQIQNQELQRKIREISLLHEMSQLLNENFERHAYYSTILELALRISDSETGAIFLVKGSSQRMQLQVSAGDWEPGLRRWFEEMPVEVEQYLNREQITELTFQDPLLREIQKRDPFIKSALLFPLILGRDKMGLGLVMHRHCTVVTHAPLYGEDIHFLTVLAQQASMIAELNQSKYDRQSQQIYLSTIAALTEAIDAKDMYTAGHSQRVAEISTAIAYKLGLTQDEIDTVHYGALLHDIGKIGVPEVILNKKGRLTDDEYFAIKKHPVIGMNILKSIEFLEGTLHIVRFHHERFDGAGYPDGLRGEEIPFIARIVGVADAWDAMTSDRSYRRALAPAVAMEELERNAGTQFDPLIIRALRGGFFSELRAV